MISAKKLLYKITNRLYYAPLFGSITGAVMSDKSVSGNGSWTNCGTITLPSGVWLLNVTVSFSTNATGYRALSVASTSASAGSAIQTARVAAVSGTTTTACICMLFKGGTLYVNAVQNSGATLTVSPRYTAVKLAEDTISVS